MNQSAPTPPRGRVGRQLFRFVVVGATTTGVQYSILIALVEGIHRDAVVASAIGYGCGAVLSYWMNRWWTFEATTRHRTAGVRFAVMVAAGFACNAAAMFVLARIASLPYLPSQVAATILTLLLNFTLARSWVFRG